jgi:putative oxidoreductase
MGNSRIASCGLTILRVVVGIVFLSHGAQKLFTYHISGVAGMFGHIGIPLPGISAVVVTLVEFFGGIALILGVVTRLAAALIAFDMLVAILAVHLKNGFFMPMGYEFALTLLAANLCLVLTGAGSLSIDGLLFGKKS